MTPPRSVRGSGQRTIRRSLKARAGVALPFSLMGITVLGVLISAIFAMTRSSSQSSVSREDAVRALHVAEAGMAHAHAILRSSLKDTSMTRLLRGWDNDAAQTADNGLLVGYSLASNLVIPDTGRVTDGGRYFAKLIDDPADGDGNASTDSNRQLLLQCVGVTESGATAEINTVLRNFSLPGVAINGNVELSGKLAITGSCGGLHANGNITGGGQPTVSAGATATGTVGPGSLSPKTNNADSLEIPDLNPANFFPAGCIHIVNSLWKPSSANLVAGNTYCVTGNVEFDADFGSAAAMRQVSVIATGSIKNGKKTFMRAAHPDGIVLMAGGDMDLQGDSGFEGIVYCGGQTYISAKPQITGQLVCKNKSPHPGTNWVPSNLISGDAQVVFNCGGIFSQFWRIAAWYTKIGS